MELADWRKAEKLSTTEVAERLRMAGDHASSTVWNWETGRARPDADVIDRIERLTQGAVTSVDMHRTRLGWLKANRPERFAAAKLPETAS